ncbi:MAG: HAD family phosphatase [Bacteroidales bacterium]|jgi:FMN phosphatase YigB (HAD superfamily)|nr:HAD family phosphatase [Bacteroidales bacterium]
MIKNIIFDFGGVIYDISHEKTKDAFEALGINNFEELYGHAIQTHLFENFEMGLISPSEFRTALRDYLNENILDKSIDDAWNALLIGFKQERLELLLKVKKNYRIFLLSNTNHIHYSKYIAELKMQSRYELFTDLFEKLYFSHQLGMRKPDAKIFNFVLQDNLINPEETVFIDDYELNISAARNLGIKGLLLEPLKDVCDLFTIDGHIKEY